MRAIFCLVLALFLSMSGPARSQEDSYPRVTAIEQALFNKTYVNDELEMRLGRLEAKVFGKASTNPDLGDRTDALQQYAEKTLNRKLFNEEDSADDVDRPPLQKEYSSQDQLNMERDYSAQNDSPSQDQSAGDQPPGDVEDYPHITELENAILHKRYSGETIEDRLNRLETTAFGAVSKNPDLSARTDALDAYAEKKLHVKSFQQQEEQEAVAAGGDRSPTGAGPGPNRSRQLLTAVGTSLINMAGMGIPGALGMGPGLGPAAMGFGGVRVRNRADIQQQQQQDANALASAPSEDPAVYDLNPPPAGARLITQVGWCEVQVFGKTFPALHLTKRLAQLNTEMNFAPGKSGIDLMDDAAKMIKATTEFKRGKSISTTPAKQN